MESTTTQMSNGDYWDKVNPRLLLRGLFNYGRYKWLLWKSDEHNNMKKVICYCDQVVMMSSLWKHPLKYVPLIMYAYMVL